MIGGRGDLHCEKVTYYIFLVSSVRSIYYIPSWGRPWKFPF